MLYRIQQSMLPFDAFNKFSRRHTCYFLEIPVCGGTLAVAYIVEEFLNVDFGIFLHRLYHIANTALGDVLHEGHARIALEGFANVGAVRL